MGHWEQALKHNIQALAYVPTDPGLLSNRERLETMVRQTTSARRQD
ncbi:hypothetical protein AB9M62_34040 [Bacillales bacterium AN1005]